jgi:restriction system protein
MAIPTYEDCMLPLLHVLSNGADWRFRDLVNEISLRLELSDADREVTLPSGQTTIANRVGWARTYLKKAGLIESPARGVLKLSPEGRRTLGEKPTRIDGAYLRKYPAFVEFVQKAKPESETQAIELHSTPEEALSNAYEAINNTLADEILDKIGNCSPAFFERLVVKLLVAMGYGGSLADAGQAIGKSGDGGIDGIIKEDKLGLDIVCIQAKRWTNVVGRPEVQAFAGSMEGHRARKGVFITTSTYSKEALDYVTRTERKIVLLDGAQLAKLMIEHGVGVTTARTLVLRKLDLDYFEDEA